jgi:hypothetical protein
VWRSKKGIPLKQLSRYRLTDVLWWTRRREIFEEIANIMGLESANTFTPGWFSHRNTAAKNIMEKMTEADKKLLRDKGDKMATEGMPDEIRRK